MGHFQWENMKCLLASALSGPACPFLHSLRGLFHLANVCLDPSLWHVSGIEMDKDLLQEGLRGLK